MARWACKRYATLKPHLFDASMKIVVASDIHGISVELRSQLACLGPHTVLSPWPGEGKPFASEQEAVTAFHLQDGLTSYARQIADVTQREPALLIGFSVGATSLWRHVSSPDCHPDSRAFLYYGSRIRDHLTLTPRCRTAVFFAESEPSFQPEAVVNAVINTGAQCEVIPGTRHGFMHPNSPHYRADLAQVHFQMIRREAMNDHR